MDEAGYGYWGFSPSNNPAGGYREYGVDQLGMRRPRLHLRPGADRRGTSPTRAAAPASRRADDVRRRRRDPARVVPGPALRARPGAGQPRQAPRATSTPTAPAASTTPSRSAAARSRSEYLSLDQGMIMAALGNALDRRLAARLRQPRRAAQEGPPAHGSRRSSPRADADASRARRRSVEDVDVHVVAVLEDRPVAAGRRRHAVVGPAVVRARAGVPDPVVEDDVLDVEPVGVGDEVAAPSPSRARLFSALIGRKKTSIARPS